MYSNIKELNTAMQYGTVVKPKEGAKTATFVQVETLKVRKANPDPNKPDILTGETYVAEHVLELPIGSHYNDGTGVLFYINKCGLIPYDQYMADKHNKEVKAKREAEAGDKGKK